MIWFEEVTTKMWIKNFNTMAKSVYFSKFEVIVKFFIKLRIKFLKLILCCKNTNIKVSIMCNHFSIAICSKQVTSVKPPFDIKIIKIFSTVKSENKPIMPVFFSFLTLFIVIVKSDNIPTVHT